MTITLSADDLWSKWGFRDGDIVFDQLCELDIDPNEQVGEDSLEELVLKHLVRTRLLPICPELVEVEEIVTCHNPIRSVDEGDIAAPEWADRVSVTITDDELRAAVERVRRVGPKVAP